MPEFDVIFALPEKLPTCPIFLRCLPENVRSLHDNCPKNLRRDFWRVEGGGGGPLPCPHPVFRSLLVIPVIVYLRLSDGLLGYVFGGDVLRLYHGDECLTIPAHDVESAQRFISNFNL